MRGVINKGLQEYIEITFGADAWNDVKQCAGCTEPFFHISVDYPDELTHRLLSACSEITGYPVDELLTDLGKFWVPNIGVKIYPAFYRIAGSTPREFLLSMDRVHREVLQNVHNATPPRFDYEEPSDDILIMHYRSERNLCALMKGLILGVGFYFGRYLKVKETACMLREGDLCTFEITFPWIDGANGSEGNG